MSFNKTKESIFKNTFHFNQDVFLSDPEGDRDGNLSESSKKEVEMIRELYPELNSWCNLSIFLAWGGYSQDIYAVGWVDWHDEKDNGFLAYIYIRQLCPDFKFGGTGLYDNDVQDYGVTMPWLSHAPLPSWVLKKA